MRNYLNSRGCTNTHSCTIRDSSKYMPVGCAPPASPCLRALHTDRYRTFGVGFATVPQSLITMKYLFAGPW
jgi:hypothetical protein